MSLKLLGILVQFDLFSLGLSNLGIQSIRALRYLNGQFFDQKVKIFDLGFICSFILLHNEVVFFLSIKKKSKFLPFDGQREPTVQVLLGSSSFGA